MGAQLQHYLICSLKRFLKVGSDLKDQELDSFTWQGYHMNKRKHNNGRKAIVKKQRNSAIASFTEMTNYVGNSTYAVLNENAFKWSVTC